MDFTGHAQVAAKQSALSCLAAAAQQLCGPGGTSGMSSMYRRALMVMMSAIVGAFGLSPARLPPTELDAVLETLTCIYEGKNTRVKC